MRPSTSSMKKNVLTTVLPVRPAGTRAAVRGRAGNGGATVGGLNYLSGTSGLCQRGANSQFFGVFSSFGPMHQNFVP